MISKDEAIKIIADYEINGCGYCHQGGEEVEEAFAMAIEALKAQESRVLSLEELIGIYNFRENHSWVYDTPPYLYMDYGKDTGHWIAWCNIVSCLERCYPKYMPEDYGKTWRCWTTKPTDEVKKVTPWE